MKKTKKTKKAVRAKKAEKTAKPKSAPGPESLGAIRKRLRAKYTRLLKTARTMIGHGERPRPPGIGVDLDVYELSTGHWRAQIFPAFEDPYVVGFTTREKHPSVRSALLELDARLSAVTATFPDPRPSIVPFGITAGILGAMFGGGSP